MHQCNVAILNLSSWELAYDLGQLSATYARGLCHQRALNRAEIFQKRAFAGDRSLACNLKSRVRVVAIAFTPITVPSIRDKKVFASSPPTLCCATPKVACLKLGVAIRRYTRFLQGWWVPWCCHASKQAPPRTLTTANTTAKVRVVLLRLADAL